MTSGNVYTVPGEHGSAISDKIRTHLRKFHSKEFQEEREKNAKFPNQKRHGLGLKPFFTPQQFVRISEGKAAYRCPYCKKGVAQIPANRYLQKRLKLRHLTTCASAPPDVSLEKMRNDWRKMMGAKGNIKQSQAKNKKQLEKAIHEAKMDRRSPAVIPVRKSYQSKNTCCVICATCLLTNGHYNWRSFCKGTWDKSRRVPPSAPWWKYYGNKIGFNKLFDIVKLSEEERKRVKKNIKDLEMRRKTPTAIARKLQKEQA